MMLKLENSKYKVELSLMAAEVVSFYDKDLQIEYIWSGDVQYWANRNPILFPVIGSSYDKKYHFSGQTTTMGNHGILRNKEFSLLSQTEDEIVLEVKADTETLAGYPFYFSLKVSYRLCGNKLTIGYRIYNDGVIDMPFNFGLHPAFNCPLTAEDKFEDYHITFDNNVYLKGIGPSVGDHAAAIKLDYQTFKQYPTWIYHNLPSSHFGYGNGKHGVNVSAVGYPVTAIWTPQAPFICLEPWNGVSKMINEDLPFTDRDATAVLKAGSSRLFTYSIELY